MIEQVADNGGKTTIVVDTGPDFREQMILAKVERIDAVVYTHAHADHVHGIDDIRGYFHLQRKPIPIYADAMTMERIEQGFGYCLETPPGSEYPPIVEANLIATPDVPLVINGLGGEVPLMPLLQIHGSIHSLGFRIGNFAYCSDVSDFPESTIAKMNGLDTLVIDALQYQPHPSHLSLDQALAWIRKLSPKRAILTHMHVPLDYDTVMAETPDNVEPGYDQMTVEIDI